jgi:mannose-6-phosphate isomerase-like protein (cupin superfamily)
MNRLLISIAAALLLLPGCTTPAGGRSEAVQRVVPIEAEPSHKIRFDNGKVRMYEVILANGQGTLMHEHQADSFSVIFGNTEVINEPRGGKSQTFKVPSGFVAFASTAKGPYSHRVVASSDSGFHVVAMELLSPAPAGSPAAAGRAAPPFKMVRENARGRAYRITLAPGASTPAFTRPAASVMFAISSGRVREEADGRPARLWDFEPGQFRWYDASETVSLKNEGSSPIDLVEIDVF